MYVLYAHMHTIQKRNKLLRSVFENILMQCSFVCFNITLFPLHELDILYSMWKARSDITDICDISNSCMEAITWYATNFYFEFNFVTKVQYTNIDVLILFGQIFVYVYVWYIVSLSINGQNNPTLSRRCVFCHCYTLP